MSSTATPIYFNGKFYAGGMNGVHRVSDRLIREVDALLAAMPPERRPPARLLIPARRQWQPVLRAIELVEQADGDTQRWEQFVLPARAADGVLVNLANLAPIRHRRKILLIHDAQFLFPDSSYPWRQRVGYRLLVICSEDRNSSSSRMTALCRIEISAARTSMSAAKAESTSVICSGRLSICSRASSVDQCPRAPVPPAIWRSGMMRTRPSASTRPAIATSRPVASDARGLNRQNAMTKARASCQFTRSRPYHRDAQRDP